MSAEFTPKPQQPGFFNKMLRPKDSAVASSSTSATSSIPPSIASLTQENDQLARDSARLQTRIAELFQQSELNQNLFQETSKMLAEKESEITGLKEALIARDSEITDLKEMHKELEESNRRNDDVRNKTIHALALQLEDMTTQLEDAHEAAAKREAKLTMLETQQKQFSTLKAEEQQQSQEEHNDYILIHWTTLHEKDKTIKFLRCRQSKSDKRIAKLKERLAAAEELSRDWEQTITLANSKAKASEIEPQIGAER
ncbi:hypothetical protein ACET3X_009284 [Alternaria dauci]|uniref:Uncharacterized protein n=1 Tax=Alternaria dauci TaxID=48095 RepID=A0ABR3U992_9PLEO